MRVSTKSTLRLEIRGIRRLENRETWATGRERSLAALKSAVLDQPLFPRLQPTSLLLRACARQTHRLRTAASVVLHVTRRTLWPLTRGRKGDAESAAASRRHFWSTRVGLGEVFGIVSLEVAPENAQPPRAVVGEGDRLRLASDSHGLAPEVQTRRQQSHHGADSGQGNRLRVVGSVVCNRDRSGDRVDFARSENHVD